MEQPMKRLKPFMPMRPGLHILLVAFGYIGLASGVYAQSQEVVSQGTLADDSGTALGTFEVHPFPAGRSTGFLYSIEVKRSDGYRWLLTPQGIQGPTDRDGGGPLVWVLREYTARGGSIDRSRPNREGQMITDPRPSLNDHVRVQLAFKPVPEPPGANWIYSAKFETLHFVGKETMSRVVSRTGKYTIDESTSLELLDNHDVISGSILTGNRRRSIHGRAYGSLVLATIDGTIQSDAVRARLELRFGTDAPKITGRYEETEETGRVISRSEKTFVAIRSQSPAKSR
jgi:hypothetical protein